MNPIPLISVMNRSSLLRDEDVAKMTMAIAHQLAVDVAPIHGITPVIEFVPAGGDKTPGGSPCWILDDPDVAGALGYHSEGPDGVPYIKVFARPILENGGTPMTGPDSVSVTLSHELIEIVGDGPANIWADGPDGNDYAYELCDACQADVYELGGVSVSNFLYPAFFDPLAAPWSKFDHLGKITEPFSMRPGGYMIRRTEPGPIDNVFAHAAAGPKANVTRVADGMFVVYDRAFPEWKRAYKTRKALERSIRRPARARHASAFVMGQGPRGGTTEDAIDLASTSSAPPPPETQPALTPKAKRR